MGGSERERVATIAGEIYRHIYKSATHCEPVAVARSRATVSTRVVKNTLLPIKKEAGQHNWRPLTTEDCVLWLWGLCDAVAGVMSSVKLLLWLHPAPKRTIKRSLRAEVATVAQDVLQMSCRLSPRYPVRSPHCLSLLLLSPLFLSLVLCRLSRAFVCAAYD